MNYGTLTEAYCLYTDGGTEVYFKDLWMTLRPGRETGECATAPPAVFLFVYLRPSW